MERVAWKHIPSPGDLSNPGIDPRSPTLQADSLPSDQGTPLGGAYKRRDGIVTGEVGVWWLCS